MASCGLNFHGAGRSSNHNRQTSANQSPTLLRPVTMGRMNIEERLKWLFYGYTSHFKPLSQPVLQSIKDEFGSMSEIALHINPIGYSELRFLLEKYDFKLKNVYREKPKNNLWLYYPVVAAIRFFNFFVSNQKRQMRWTNELNSNEIMFGGNTLIVHAVLEK